MTLNPANVVSGLALATLEEENGDDDAAQHLLTDLLRHAPHDPRPHRALASFYARHNRPGLASRVERVDYIP